jgi:hypothetical protein
MTCSDPVTAMKNVILNFPRLFQIVSLSLVLMATAAIENVRAAAPDIADRSAMGELNYWNAVKDSGNPEDIKSYLDAFPDGMFSDPASARYLLLTGQQPLLSAGDRQTASDEDATRTAKPAGARKQSAASSSKSKKKAVSSRKTSKSKKQQARISKKSKSTVAAKKPACKSTGAQGCAVKTVQKKRSIPVNAGGGGGGGGGGSGGGGGWN